MPRVWVYYVALVLPLIASVLILDTRFFIEWLWYNHYTDYYETLNTLSVQPQLQEFLGGLPFPIFVIAVICYWKSEDQEPESLTRQFALLPIFYLPVLAVGRIIQHWQFDLETMYFNPFTVLVGGYIYVLPWIVLVWILSMLRLVE